jgi:riboflavin transporter FmnP
MTVAGCNIIGLLSINSTNLTIFQLSMTPQTEPIRLQLKALLVAWATLVFGTSALLVLASPLHFKTYSSNVLANFFRATWEVADEVGPLVKISLIVVFTLLVVASEKFIKPRFSDTYGVSALLAVLAIVVVLSALPETYSRGFGIGLTGTRFDECTITIYLLGAVLSGIVYQYSLQKQRAQLQSPPSRA